MKIKGKRKLLQELARECENPREFIYGIMALQNQKVEDVARGADMTIKHFHVFIGRISKGKNGISPKLCIKLSRGLDIDPYILNRVIGDFNIKTHLQEQQTE